LENSKCGVDIHWIGLLTKALKCRPAELISTNGMGESSAAYAPLRSEDKVPILGIFGAGGELVFDEKAPVKSIKTPEGIAQNAIALTVKGDSMEPAFREGDTVILDDV
jgi:SOS-response transcriptional repressor LexA